MSVRVFLDKICLLWFLGLLSLHNCMTQLLITTHTHRHHTYMYEVHREIIYFYYILLALFLGEL